MPVQNLGRNMVAGDGGDQGQGGEMVMMKLSADRQCSYMQIICADPRSGGSTTYLRKRRRHDPHPMFQACLDTRARGAPAFERL